MNEIIYPGFRWLVLVTMFIVTTIASIFLIAPAPLIGEIIKAMPQLSVGQITFMTMSIFNISLAMATIFGGLILDKFGIMKVYIGGLIIISIGALLMPYIGYSFRGIIFVRILQGLGTGPIMVAVIPIAARYFPPKQRSILIVLQEFSTLLGVQIGLVFISRLCQATGSWQSAMAWLTPISIVGLIFSFIVASSPKQPEKESPRGNIAFKEDIKIAFLRPVTWVVIGCVAMLEWMYQAFNDVIPAFFNATPPLGLGYDPAVIGSLLSSVAILMIFGGIIGVLITEKFLKGNPRPVVLSGFLLAAIFIFLIKVPAISSNHMILGISVFATAFFSAFIRPQALGYIAKYYPKHITGTLGGLTMLISSFVSLAGIAACSKALQISGYQVSLTIIVCVGILGAIIALFLKPVKEV